MKHENSPRTVLITGCSSGIGRATARRFQRAGWNVVATMPQSGAGDRAPPPRQHARRKPRCPRSVEHRPGHRGRTGALRSHRRARQQCRLRPDGRVRGTAAENGVRRQFETNVFGLMRVTRALLPLSAAPSRPGHQRGEHGRQIAHSADERLQRHRSGPWRLLGGRSPTSSRASISSSRSWSPAPSTRSSSDARATWRTRPASQPTRSLHRPTSPGARQDRLRRQYQRRGGRHDLPRCTTDGKATLRYQVGLDAKALLSARKLLPDRLFMSLIQVVLPARSSVEPGRLFYKVQ